MITFDDHDGSHPKLKRLDSKPCVGGRENVATCINRLIHSHFLIRRCHVCAWVLSSGWAGRKQRESESTPLSLLMERFHMNDGLRESRYLIFHPSPLNPVGPVSSDGQAPFLPRFNRLP